MSATETARDKERRRAPRVPLCLVVTAECDAWTTVCFTRDLSETGLFLISQRLPGTATGFSLEVHLPQGLPTLRGRAVVVRVQPDGPRGFGVEFKDLGPVQRQMLADLWNRWERTFPSGQA